jgi:protease secretion system membrane fusion protein
MNSQNIEASLPRARSVQPRQRPPERARHGARDASAVGAGRGFWRFLLWAGLAPLDEGVPGQGLVTLDTKRKAVQHLTGGIVKEVLVHEGAEVTEGQLLIKLDEAMARANYESARQRYLGLRAMQGRLQAEQTGSRRSASTRTCRRPARIPLIRQQMFNQEQLFRRRGAALLRSDLQSIEESIRGSRACCSHTSAC